MTLVGQQKEAEVATATIVDNKLTVALTAKAKAGNDSSNTAVWVFAHDAAGEYARKQINVTVGSPTNPYVMTALDDVVIRQDAAETALSDLHTGFMDPEDFTLRPDQTNDAIALEYAVTISDANAQKVSTGEGTFTLVTPYMIAKVTEGATASMMVTPRDVASVMVTVTATDKGVRCRTGFTFVAEDAASRFGAPADAIPEVDRCIEDTGTRTEADSTGTFPDTKSVSDVFQLSIISQDDADGGCRDSRSDSRGGGRRQNAGSGSGQ